MAKRGNGEGSIYKRKEDGKWVGSITLENHKRRVFYGKTRKEVQEKLKVAMHEQQQGTLITAPQQTLKSYLEHWLEDVHKPSIRISTYVKYKKLVKYIVADLGNVPLQKLTPQLVQKLYADKLKQGLDPKMVTNIHGVLHKALDNAVKWNLVARNVCDAVSPPRIPKIEKQVLTKQQAHTLLEHVKKHRLEAILTVALTTGMRRGEMLALRWRDVNIEDSSIQVMRTVDYIPHYGYVENEPKTARGRRKIMLPSFVVDILKFHRLQQIEERTKVGAAWVEKDLVFCGLHGDYFNPNYLLRVFKKVLVDAGLPHMRFHDLRHSAATILLSMKVHPKVVQEVLGHSTITMTLDTYSHVLPSMQQDATDGWDNEFRSSL
jgi:integrase